MLIPVAADDLVAGFRQIHNAASVARRLPPHVTVLFPFAQPETIAADVHAELIAHFAGFEPFEAELVAIRHFDDFVWLAPEPRSGFLDLIAATCARFPAFPPYGGALGEPEPHLTIAAVESREQAVEVEELAREALAPRLPFSFSVTEVVLFEELADGTWRPSSRFGLG